LPSELYAELRREAEQLHRPVTELVRTALAYWLEERKRQRLHSDIAEFAREFAGTELDLDPLMEQASVEFLSVSGRRQK
jgi:hypothetical protein